MNNRILLISLAIILTTSFYSCFHRKVVSSCQINAIRLVHVQNTNADGSNWDAFGNGLGDVQIRITNRATNQLVFVSENFNDASYTNTYMFMRSLPLLLSDINAPYHVDVFDIDDLSADEWMGGFDLNLAEYIDKKEILLKNTSTPMEITILLNWNYQEKK